jgi:predicted transcriptional regulator
VTLKKPSEVIKSKLVEDYSPLPISIEKNLKDVEYLEEFKSASSISESFNFFKNNLEKLAEINTFQEKIESLKSQITEKITREDLENAMLSQLMIIDENFIQIKSQVNGINRSDLRQFRETVRNIENVVNNLIENEIPSYKKLITSSDVNLNSKVESLEDKIFEDLQDYKNLISEFILSIDNKITEYNSILEQNVKIISEQDKKLSSTSNHIASVAKIVNTRIEEDKRQRDIFFTEVDSKILDIKTNVSIHEEHLTKFFDKVDNKILDIRDDVVHNEEHLKKVDTYLQNHHSRVINLREEVFNEIKKLPIGDFDNNIRELERKINRIEELYGSINIDTIVENVLKEGLLTEPPETKNSDPLTPLDQNFVTQQELQNHYKLFLNRIQQQLSTIGGGGETQLKYLDDIVGIATNAAAYDGKVLSYNHSLRKFEFIVGGGGGNAAITISDTPPANPQAGNLWYDSSIGRTFIYYVDIDGSQWVDASPSGGVPQNIINTWVTTSVGIHTLSSVGIGTTDPTSALTVSGDVLVVGIVTATDFNSASDVKLKKNITVIDNPLDKIIRLEGVNFQWKETGKKSLGVIAQEVEKV